MQNSTSEASAAAIAALGSAVGARYAVSAAVPEAADAGMRALADGGNIFDAAVTAALVETVLLPPKCGLAGDLVALVVIAGSEEPHAVLSIGPAPGDLAQQIRDGGPLPTSGPWSVGMPGAPAGYAALSSRGVLGLARQAAPAVELATEGFLWPRVAARLTESSTELLLSHARGPVPYVPGGEPLREGALVRLPGLARLLSQFVQDGPELFVGEAGRAVLETLAARGRTGLTTADLTSARVEVAEPARAELGGRRLWATPDPTHGPSLLDAALALAGQDGPAAVLSATEAAVARRPAQLHDTRHSGTSVVTAADVEGNAVVVVHSNSYQRYGSGLVVDDYGLVLSNRAGRGFSSDPASPNFPVPGRRPATTLHAWALGYKNACGVQMLGATPGGENQMRWNAQVLALALAGDTRPGSLVSAPRWARYGDELLVEASHPLADPDLVPAGITVQHRQVPDLSLPSAEQVVVLEPGAVSVAADPRTRAAARAR
jgi:gamma-glutamyltranspeptidase/glutathione hydrolase